ncbi:MAG: hypothetical protein IPJ25_10095 [Rhodocyclaceae bacterium]|nr:hypothetical protein [Rhodocyclaceae bacterium]
MSASFFSRHYGYVAGFLFSRVRNGKHVLEVKGRANAVQSYRSIKLVTDYLGDAILQFGIDNSDMVLTEKSALELRKSYALTPNQLIPSLHCLKRQCRRHS